jgi:hypothetical protein
MKKRIGWIDGIKGIACLCVLWHHIVLAFFPAAYYGNSEMTHTKSQIDVWLSQTPWAVFINGNYMVTLLCVLSAVILGLQVMKLQDKSEVSQILLKRYPRLMLPIAPIVFLVYIMLRYELFGHLDVATITNSPWLTYYYLEKVDLRKCIESLFITTWFSTDSTFSNAFWMLGYLLMGSFLTIIRSTFSWYANRKVIGIYVFIAVLYLHMNKLGAAFVLGVLLAYCYKEFESSFRHTGLGIVCLLGAFFGRLSFRNPAGEYIQLFKPSAGRNHGISVLAYFWCIVDRLWNVEYKKPSEMAGKTVFPIPGKNFLFHLYRTDTINFFVFDVYI